MCVLSKDQDRKSPARLESVRSIRNDLGFVFLEKAEEIRKLVVCFRIEQGREKPKIL